MNVSEWERLFHNVGAKTAKARSPLVFYRQSMERIKGRDLRSGVAEEWNEDQGDLKCNWGQRHEVPYL